MTYSKILLGFCLLLPLASFGMQYRVEGSPERHEIAGGIFNYPMTTKKIPELKSGFFLDYSFYFHEIHKLTNNQFKSYGQFGIALGANFFNQTGQGDAFSACSNEGSYPLFLHAGPKVRVSYLENIIPSVSYGLAIPKCSSQLSNLEEIKSLEIHSSSSSLNRYLSIGLDVSLKLFDKASVYALDEDYGINDIGIHLKCILFSAAKKSSQGDKPWLCQVGLSVLF